MANLTENLGECKTDTLTVQMSHLKNSQVVRWWRIRHPGIFQYWFFRLIFGWHLFKNGLKSLKLLEYFPLFLLDYKINASSGHTTAYMCHTFSKKFM